MALAEFKQVSKTFGSKKVLENASLSIEKGETLTIIGGSGIGKTVFLKLLLGLLKPDQGEILFHNQNIGDMEEKDIIKMRSRIGMLFQSAALFDSLSVAENIAYPLREHFNYNEEEIETIVRKKLDLVGLQDVENLMPAELSGGMKKRVGLARAIATDPDIILYDEPTTGLDPANTRRICNLILELQQKLEVTSLVVTHDMESAFRVTNRIALISNHKFAFIGTKQEAQNSQDPLVKNFINGNMETGES
ncbi:MAG: ABC transporter ATP-binding protein [Pseudomonadota bacterium]